MWLCYKCMNGALPQSLPPPARSPSRACARGPAGVTRVRTAPRLTCDTWGKSKYCSRSRERRYGECCQSSLSRLIPAPAGRKNLQGPTQIRKIHREFSGAPHFTHFTPTKWALYTTLHHVFALSLTLPGRKPFFAHVEYLQHM